MIKPSEFEYKESRWQDLYVFFRDKGYEVYAPEQHVGDCLSKYIVVMYGGESKVTSISSRFGIYSILCYVPRDRYSELEPFVFKVRSDLKELKPLFKPLDDGAQTQVLFDDTVNGHYVSLEYKNVRKI